MNSTTHPAGASESPGLAESGTPKASTSGRDTAATAVFKLAEVASRLLFLLSALLLLDPKSAGQFGLLNTLVALFSLFVGFERWGVLWRKLSNIGADECGALIANTLKFFQFNYLIWSPVFVAIAYFWIKLSWFEITLGLCIAICEQLAVGAYWLATVNGQYRWLILITAAKNFAMLATLGVLLFGFSHIITLTVALEIWAIAGFISVLTFAILRSGRHSIHLKFTGEQIGEITDQYRESRTHFLTGLAAFSSGQIDRIVVGTAVDLSLTGLYFKNLFIAASVYSAVTILLHNRVVRKIYIEAGQRRYDVALSITRRESAKAFSIFASMILLMIFVGQQDFIFYILNKYSISWIYIVGLLIAFFLRTLADYNCTILNAAGYEKWILAIHTSSISISAVLIFFLTRSFGVVGAVVAIMVGCSVLLILSEVCRNRVLSDKAVRLPRPVALSSDDA